MRCCHICKRQEYRKAHMQGCPYYWALIGAGQGPLVEPATCFVEDTEGCPLTDVTSDREGCGGCIECDIESDQGT